MCCESRRNCEKNVRTSLALVGLLVGVMLSNCAWAVDGVEDSMEQSLDQPVSSSAIACPQYGDIAGQAIFYPQGSQETKPVTINLEIAQTIAQQRCGLMFRDRLPDDRGMGFPFEPPRPVSFWMKNVPVALDMVFVEQDAEGYQILDTVTAPSCASDRCPTYAPKGDGDVAWVIELAEGRAADLDLKKGDRVEIQRSPSVTQYPLGAHSISNH